MGKISETIYRISNKQTLGPSSVEKIEQAEMRLGLKFADEYKEYLSTFGALVTDYVELTHVENGIANVCVVTEKLRERYRNVPRDMYVIFNFGVDGLVALQNGQGKIFYIDPYELTSEFDSLSDLLCRIEFKE